MSHKESNNWVLFREWKKEFLKKNPFVKKLNPQSRKVIYISALMKEGIITK